MLEIIGNSKNVEKLQKHFKKMFAGVSTLTLSEDCTLVLGLASREGEEVSHTACSNNEDFRNIWVGWFLQLRDLFLASSRSNVVYTCI